MSLTDKRRFLQTQVLEMDRLRVLSADDPFTSIALDKRRELLAQELAIAPASPAAARTVLFFAGRPVYGSEGIDAHFASKILDPFLEMVKTQYSAQKHGRVGARGPRRDENEARLLLTGLPRGSFGLELSQPQPEDFVAAEQLSDTLVRLTEIIASAAENDERFAFSLEKVSPRIVPRLREFLDVAAHHEAYLKMQSGDLSVELPPERLREALGRVGAVRSTERVLEDVVGVFRGATLDSWRFDFSLENGTLISGRISEELSDADVAAMIPLTTRNAVARLHETILITRDGIPHSRFELLGLRSADQLVK